MKSANKTVEAVLLDVDGTLVDSNALHAQAWQRAFAQYGIEVDFDTVLHQIGKGGDQLLPVFVPREQLPRLGDAIESYRKDLFQREYLPQVKPFSKVRQFIERLKEDGLKIAIASSAGKEELQHYKKLAHIDHLIEEETTSQDAEHSKPHPDIFSAAIERLGVQPEVAVTIGDTPYDAEASGKAGIRAIGVTSGGWSKEDLHRAGCAEIYRDVAELLASYDRSLLSGKRSEAA